MHSEINIAMLRQLLNEAMRLARLEGVEVAIFNEDWYYTVSLVGGEGDEAPPVEGINSLVDDWDELNGVLHRAFPISTMSLGALGTVFAFLGAGLDVGQSDSPHSCRVSLATLERLARLHLNNTVAAGMMRIEAGLEEYWLIEPVRAVAIGNDPVPVQRRFSELLARAADFLHSGAGGWRTAATLLGQLLYGLQWSIDQSTTDQTIAWMLGHPLDDLPARDPEPSQLRRPGPPLLMGLEVAQLRDAFLKLTHHLAWHSQVVVMTAGNAYWTLDDSPFEAEPIAGLRARSPRDDWEELRDLARRERLPLESDLKGFAAILRLLARPVSSDVSARVGLGSVELGIEVELALLVGVGLFLLDCAQECGLGSLELPFKTYSYVAPEESGERGSGAAANFVDFRQALLDLAALARGDRGVEVDDYWRVSSAFEALSEALLLSREARLAWYGLLWSRG